MKKIKEWLAVIGVVVVFLLVAAFAHPEAKQQPDMSGQVQQLQTEVQQLRAELEDVKHVQGYMAWETDWRNRRGE